MRITAAGGWDRKHPRVGKPKYRTIQKSALLPEIAAALSREGSLGCHLRLRGAVKSVAHATHRISGCRPSHSRSSARLERRQRCGRTCIAGHAGCCDPCALHMAIDGNGPASAPSADQSGKDARSDVGAADTVAEQGKEFATDTSLRGGQIRLRWHARVPFMALDEHVQPPGDRIETDQIAVADLADRTALHRFGRDVDRCRNLA